MSAPAPPQHGAPGALPSVADPLETFTVARKGVQLTLTPVLATNSARDAELREAAISLYHHVLPSVGRKLVRTILEGERARTIMLMRSVEDVLAERELAAGAVGAAAKAPAATGGCPAEDEDADDAATSSFSGPSDGEDESGDGGGTGSDADAEEGDEEEGEEEAGDGEEEGAAAPGAEPAVRAKHRIVGAASFELVEPSQCPRGLAVLQLTLIGVRTKHQQLGLGSQLLRRAVDPRLAGPHDTLLAFADHDAVDFFRRHGFTDDVIVTSQFRAVVDSWEQSVLMVRSVVPVPPRAGFELHAEPADAASVAPRSAVLCPPATLTEPRYASAADVGDAIDAWREQRLQSYSQELGLLERLRGEVQTLRRRSVRQDDYVSFLIAQLAQLTHERDAVAAEYAAYRARAEPVLAAAASGAPRPDDDGEAAPGGDGRVDAARRLAQVEPASRLFGRLAESFAASLRPSEHACPPLAAVRIWQLASDAERAARRARYDMSRGPAAADSSAGGSRFELELYLGAPLAVLQQVLAFGFDGCDWPPRHESHARLEAYGEGAYLSRYASKAHHFGGGCEHVLLVVADLRNAQMVVLPSPDRTAPDDGASAIITPGRPLPLGAGGVEGSAALVGTGQAQGEPHAEEGLSDLAGNHRCGEEIVIFRKRLPPLLPVCLIEYVPASDAPDGYE